MAPCASTSMHVDLDDMESECSFITARTSLTVCSQHTVIRTTPTYSIFPDDKTRFTPYLYLVLWSVYALLVFFGAYMLHKYGPSIILLSVVVNFKPNSNIIDKFYLFIFKIFHLFYHLICVIYNIII